MLASKSLKIAALALLLPAASMAEVVVSHFEPIRELRVVSTDTQSQSFDADARRTGATRLSFEALGQRFEFALATNERVAASVPVTSRNSGIQIYRGGLLNNADSWARIVTFDGRPSGIFSDGVEMYAIESPGDSSMSIDSPVVYRLANVFIAAGTMNCGTDRLVGRASSVSHEIMRSSKAAMAQGPGALSEILVSVVGDFEFTSARGGDAGAVAAIAARMNNVDGFFSEQIGVQITVKQPIETHADTDDPFTDTIESEDLLDELSEYRDQNGFHNTAGLTHLWTGRDLDGTTAGIAWRGALCDSYFSAGLSEANDGVFIDSLIAAHEIGHNFNAQHDGEPGTSCPDDTANFIMSASVNGSTTFSDCSIAVIQAEAAGAACVLPLPTVDVGIVPTVNVSDFLLGVSTDVQYQVSSNGLLDAGGVQANVLVPANLTLDNVAVSTGSCSAGAGVVNCDLGDLVGLSNETITLSVTPAAVGNGSLTATVSTTGSDERADNNQVVSAYSIEAPVDLIAREPTAPDVLLDSSTTVSAVIENVSARDATDVTANIVLENGIEAVSANWPVGTCTVTAQQVDCQATSLAAMSTSTLTINVNAVLRGRRDVTVTLASAEPEATPQDNSVTGDVLVTIEDQGNDDSGSGAMHPILLLIGLVSAFVARRRRIALNGPYTA